MRAGKIPLPHRGGEAVSTSRSRKVLAACLLGAMVGVLAASSELAVLAQIDGWVVVKSLALPMVLIYGLLVGLVGLCLGLAATVLVRWFGRLVDGINGASLCLALLIGGGLALEASVVLLKRHFLPYSATFPMVLLSGLAISIVTVVLLHTTLLKVLRSFQARGWLRPTRLPLVGVVSCTSLVVIALIITFAPAPRARSHATSTGPRDRPDVFVILVDAMRPDHMSAYGYGRETTPVMERLAGEGALFMNAHAQSSWTKPTTATLFTSLYPSVHKVWDLEDVIPAAAVTMPQVFKAAGYQTAIFSATVLISPQFGFGRGVDVFITPDYSVMGHFSAVGFVLNRLSGRMGGAIRILWNSIAAAELYLRGDDPDVTTYTAEQINSQVIDWAESRGDAPLFAYVHYLEPHATYEPPPPFDTLFASSEDARRRPLWPPKNVDMLFPFSEADSLSDQERQYLIAGYDGELAYVDSCIGKLLDQLETLRHGNAILVVTSDHGEEFYEHRGWSHGISLFEEVLKIPLILWWPERVSAGLRVPGLVRQIDIFPTLLELCGIPPVGFLMGESLAPVLVDGDEASLPGMSLSELKRSRGREVRAIQDRQFKLIAARKGDQRRLMLFDLLADPGETNDLSQTMPQKADEMLTALKGALSVIEAHGLRKETPATIDRQTRDILRSLGYIE